MQHRILGIDPGSDGAGALMTLVGGSPYVVRAAAWDSPSKGVWRVTTWVMGESATKTVRRHEEVGEVFWATPPAAVVSEDVFIGRNARTAMQLVRYAERMISGCRLAWDVAPIERRVMEPRWRKAIGLPPSSRQTPDGAPEMMLRLVPNLAEVVSVLGRAPHIFDAVAVGYTGLRIPAWTEDWDRAFASKKGRRAPRRGSSN